MISYEIYKILHITGILMVFIGLAGILAARMIVPQIPDRTRRLFFLLHGLGLIIALVAGFGLAARLGIARSMPMWVYAKILIWLVLGASIALAKRKGQMGAPIIFLFLALGSTAAWLAITKPF